MPPPQGRVFLRPCGVSAENRINLVRDRLFWQAWNRSAFLADRDKSVFFLNEQIEKLLDCLRAEFCNVNTRIAGATLNQSSGTLPPAVKAGEHEKSYENFSMEGTFS